MEIKINIIKKELNQLKESNGNLIHVSNAEWYSLFKDEIRNSIAIEGVFANRQELIDVLEHNKKTDKQKAAAILGYFESASAMYEYAATQYKEKEFTLRMSDIKQIHILLMRYEKDSGFYIGKIGEFRDIRSEVTQSTFTPIREFYVRPVMELWVKWVNHYMSKSDYDPVVLASIAHVWFESIHPFRDGNGRTGRILMSYILIGCGLINVAIKGISKKDRDLYYDALEQADDVFESMHRKIEEGMSFDVGDVNKVINKKDFNDFVFIVAGRLKDSFSRIKEIDIKNIDKEAQLSLSDLSKIFDYSQDYLRNLINRGKLKGEKRGKIWYVKVRDMAAYVEKLKSNGK